MPVRLAVGLDRLNAGFTDSSPVTILDYVFVVTRCVVLYRQCSTVLTLYAEGMRAAKQFKVLWRRKKHIQAVLAGCQRFASTCLE
jgi:hypothetical protein